jgi:flagellar export protein FliJ
MPTFAFRLDPVLAERRRLEDLQRFAFAAAISTLRAAEAGLDDRLARRAEMRERLTAIRAGADPIEWRAACTHCDYLDRSIAAQQRDVAEAQVRAERERALLAIKTRDTNVLETLKERRLAAFDAEASAAEQREIEERNARRCGPIPVCSEDRTR